MITALLVAQLAASGIAADPFAFFHPPVTVTVDDRRQLDRGEAIIRVLPGRDLEIAVFGAVPVSIDGDRLVEWVRRIEAMKKSTYVLAIHRFSNPPRIEDVAELTLEDDELRDVRACRPGDCALKLSAREMMVLKGAATAAGTGWKDAVQQAFRRVVLERVQAYIADGRAAAYDDNSEPVSPILRFAALLDHLPFLLQYAPEFVEHLRGYPTAASSELESFFYWSKERLTSTPIISITHVNILRGHRRARVPDALVAGKEIFATHYVNASLGLTAIVCGSHGGPNYLAYVNRSEVDVLSGPFAGLVRFFMQKRLKSEAATVLAGLRQRLEGGPPPP